MMNVWTLHFVISIGLCFPAGHNVAAESCIKFYFHYLSLRFNPYFVLAKVDSCWSHRKPGAGTTPSESRPASNHPGRQDGLKLQAVLPIPI
jgi:hypothetical protein